MAKDRKKLLHIHSSIPDKQPTAASLEVGEIAVNNAANQEFISLKNSDDKVVRLSSDGQIVTIMEKKEVMPYDGYVRGETGPSGTEDAYGSYGITENDLLNNTSNIVIKLNQVAAANTVKHGDVNGAKDRYNKCVNPTSDEGLTDGAGFYIDMSRYAMQGANPTFSGITNTCYTVLNGRTEILGGSGTAGSCRSLLNVDVLSATTNISTAWTTVGTADTTIGTDILHVTGTTTETHDDVVSITNNNNKTETTKGNVETNVSGTTSENYKEAVTINNLSTKTETTTGANNVYNKDNYNVNTTGTTNLTSTGNTNIHSDANICETADVKATLYGAAQTNVGLNCTDNDASTVTNVYGDTLKVSADTANTTATTANYNGTTLNSNINNVTHSGQTLSITENTTDIASCGHLHITTNDFKLEQCSGSQGSASLKFCNGFTVDSNKLTLEECTAGSGSILIKETTSEISGTNLTINESDDVKINVGDDLIVNTSGDTTITTTGQTKIASTQNACLTSSADVNVGGDVNTKIGADCNGTTGFSNNTYITASSSAITYAPNVVNSGTTNNNTFNTINNTATTENNNIATINTTATTINTSATTINQSGDTYNVTAKTETHITTAFTVNSTSAACIISNDVASVGGDVTTNIGSDCSGNAISNTTNIYGNVMLESGVTNNNKFETINNITNVFQITGETKISGDTNISGDTYITGDLHVTGNMCPTSGLCKTLSWTYGSVCNASNGSTNFKDDVPFVIPKTISDVTCGDVTNESGCLNIGKDVCVSGKVTASNGFFQSSDRNLKENIERPNFDKFIGANKTPIMKFNYISDETKRDTYGVIAQEAEANGLNELIYTDENGNKAVDYTSLLILKIGFLENEIKLLRYRLNKLDGLN